MSPQGGRRGSNRGTGSVFRGPSCPNKTGKQRVLIDPSTRPGAFPRRSPSPHTKQDHVDHQTDEHGLAPPAEARRPGCDCQAWALRPSRCWASRCRSPLLHSDAHPPGERQPDKGARRIEGGPDPPLEVCCADLVVAEPPPAQPQIWVDIPPSSCKPPANAAFSSAVSA